MSDHEVKDLPWRCPSCEAILGYLTSDLKVLRMKYKDHYVFIEEAQRVVTLCRKCGKQCSLTQQQQ